MNPQDPSGDPELTLEPWSEVDQETAAWLAEEADAPPAELNGHHKPRVRADLPEIRYGLDLHRVLEETTAAMADPVAGDPLLFQRANELVTVVAAPAPLPGARAPIAQGTPIIRQHSSASLLPRLTRFVRISRAKPPSKAAIQLAQQQSREPEPVIVPVTPPPTLVNSLLALGSWEGVRPLIGVLETPYLRPDGELQQTPGYDPSTGYLYRPACHYPPVPDAPTQTEARAALAELLGLLRDFPFATPEHALVPIAAILTVLARPAIDGAVPAFVFEASTRGSGKTLQADVVSLVATGRQASRQPFPEDDDELAKVLSSYALRAAPLVLLDNVARALAGAALDMALTASDEVAFRLLGHNTIVSLPWRTVVMASGNNLSFGEDTLRRVLVSRLEPTDENPEDRVLRDLRAHVREHRPRLVAAALTVLRAYTAHDSPDAGLPPWGSFESWSRLVPHALAFAGDDRLLACRPRGERAATDEALALRVLLTDLPRLSERPLTARGLLSLLYPAPHHEAPPDGWEDLRAALEAIAPPRGGPSPSPAELGRRLGRLDGRVLQGRRLRYTVVQGNRTWWVDVLRK